MATLTDDEKQKMLSEGTAIEFGPLSDEDWSNHQLREARVIQSDWINALVDADETVCVPILIDGAIIRGRLQLEYVTFQRLVSITNTAFENQANFSYSTFKRTARFDGSGFGKAVSFHDVHVERDFEVNGVQFRDRSSFSDLRIDGFLLSKLAKYGGPVAFDRTVVSKGAYFEGAEFFSEARLWSMQIKGQAIFIRARFHGSFSSNHSNHSTCSHIFSSRECFARPERIARLTQHIFFAETARGETCGTKANGFALCGTS